MSFPPGYLLARPFLGSKAFYVAAILEGAEVLSVLPHLMIAPLQS